MQVNLIKDLKAVFSQRFSQSPFNFFYRCWYKKDVKATDLFCNLPTRQRSSDFYISKGSKLSYSRGM